MINHLTKTSWSTVYKFVLFWFDFLCYGANKFLSLCFYEATFQIVVTPLGRYFVSKHLVG